MRRIELLSWQVQHLASMGADRSRIDAAEDTWSDRMPIFVKLYSPSAMKMAMAIKFCMADHRSFRTHSQGVIAVTVKEWGADAMSLQGCSCFEGVRVW